MRMPMGKITMAANGIKEVIQPFPFGTAIALRFAWMPQLTEIAERVVGALKYRGILMIEFVKDKKSGQWKVIEVNPRHWLFSGYYHRLGVNYTQALYRDAYGSIADNNLITVSREAIDEDHIHLDLVSMAEYFQRNHTGPYLLAHFINDLKSLGGSLSSAFLASTDPNPGRRFVISGYLITVNILRSLANGSFTFRSFYLRQIVRVFPALLFTMQLTTVLAWWVLPSSEYSALARS